MSATKEFHHNKIEQGQRTAIANTRDYPILFDTEMVKSILSGQKTQTRRLFKPPLCRVVETANKIYCKDSVWHAQLKNGHSITSPFVCPYGTPGDLLWVKETWTPSLSEVAYKADYSKDILSEKRNKGLWHPSIHMPKTAARIWLKITEIKAQRIQTITEEEAKAEGIGVAKIFGFNEIGQSNYREGFFAKWVSIYGIESWYENPWVWAITFNVTQAVQNKPLHNNELS